MVHFTSATYFHLRKGELKNYVFPQQLIFIYVSKKYEFSFRTATGVSTTLIYVKPIRSCVSYLLSIRVYNRVKPSLNVTRFFTMADNIPSPPLQQPKTLSQLILRPWFATVHLIQYLTLLPNALDSEAALTELCTRDFPSIFKYLLSLGYNHWHRRFLLTCLRARLNQLHVNVLKREIAPASTHTDSPLV